MTPDRASVRVLYPTSFGSLVSISVFVRIPQISQFIKMVIRSCIR